MRFLGQCSKMYIPESLVSVEMFKQTKTGIITDGTGVTDSWRRLADDGDRQAAIMNQMIAAHGAAYIAAANMILQANYLWPHKGNCQCAVLYLSVLTHMFSCHRERNHEGRRERDALKSILSQEWIFGMWSSAHLRGKYCIFKTSIHLMDKCSVVTS